MVRWTEEQTHIITARGRNLLVSAGAGSGKTAVLTERIIRLMLDDGIDADRFVVLTFTKAAASEMKRRIRKELFASYQISPDKQAVRRQIELLEKAQISTIHAFCLAVIKRYYYVIGLDPASSILTDSESVILKQEALEELFEEKYETEDEAFLALADLYSPGNDDGRLKDLILELARFLSDRPDPEGWLNNACAVFSSDKKKWEAHPAVLFLRAHAARVAAAADDLLSQALGFCTHWDEDGKRTERLQEMREDILRVKQAAEGTFSELLKTLSALKFARYDVRTPCERSDEIKQLRAEAKGLMDGLKKMFGFSYESYLGQLHEIAPAMQTFAQTARDFSARYTAKKAERTAMDYGDLEHHCLAILQDETTRDEIRATYDYVFVDEYQDTNAMQEEILNLIARGDNLFAVGDIKQSIYRFRGAEPDIFMRRYHDYEEGRDDSELIFLNCNFRTVPRLIDSVNFLFSRLMYEETGGVDYLPNEILTAGKEALCDKKAELNIVVLPEASQEADNDPILLLKNQEIEADAVVQMIQTLLTEEIYDEKEETLRAVRPGDIAVIGRSLNARAEYYMQALKQAGIETETEQSGSYYDEMEVALITDLLKVIDNEKNDLPLIGVMRSFLYGFDADEMLKIRVAYPSELYYHAAVFRYGEEGSDQALKTKIARMLRDFSDYRELSRHVSVEKLLRTIYQRSRIFSYMGALPQGARRTEHLRYLTRLASEYEQSTFKGLYHFILYIEKSKRQDAPLCVQSRATKTNGVHLMTVHKSKGLEFPIVIFTGCGDRFNAQDTAGDLVLHKEFGLCPMYYDLNRSFRTDSILKIAAKQKLKQEMLAEEMRILYVGATRAEQRLMFFGTARASKAENLLGKSTSLTPLGIFAANSYLDWMTAAILTDENAVLSDNAIETESWHVSVVPYESQSFVQQPQEEKSAVLPQETACGSHYDEIAAILDFQYPYQTLTTLPSKLSVSALKDEETLAVGARVIDLQDAPRFAAEAAVLSNAQIGTLVHRLLAKLDFASLKEIAPENILRNLEEQIVRLQAQGIFNESETAYLQPEIVADFLQTPLGEKLLHAEEIHRETPFLVRIPANELHKDWYDITEKIPVQGMIDCWFVSDGTLYLLDYKTDNIADSLRLEQATAAYTKQIDLYDRALFETFGKRADERFLCYLQMGKTVTL